MTEEQAPKVQPENKEEKRERTPFEQLPPAAQRALKEAEARREAEKCEAGTRREIGGRGGKDPARYGDWEIKGRTIDF